MARGSPFKGHRYPRTVILSAVRWCCRYALSYRDVRNLLAERGVEVDVPTVYRWVQKFGPEIAKRSAKLRNWRGLNWHVDETYIRVGGKWRYFWRAVDQNGQLIDFRLTARRNVKAARAFLRQAFETAGRRRPATITTDRASTYRTIIAERNVDCDPPDRIRHVDRKYLNNRIESDHASLKKITTPMRGFCSLRTAKSALEGIEAMRMIVKGGVYDRKPGVQGEIGFVRSLFPEAA